LADEDSSRALRVALWLVACTAAYNVAEATIAVWSGVSAGSIALVGFGLDSVIECVAAGVLLWRLWVESRGHREDAVEETEGRVLRVVGVTFIALALYITGQSAWIFLGGRQPEESSVGIVLAGISLVIMPLVAWGKLRAAASIGSAALRAEAKETLACSFLSLALLIGLAANAVAGWWWADPMAALIMVPWLVKEGREALRGECCCE